MADSQRVSERFKSQTQTRTITAVTFLALVYAYFFLPTSALTFFEGRLKTVGGVLGVGLVGALGGVLGSVLSAQDLLATGNSRAARFFRSQYPSESIKANYIATRTKRMPCGSKSSTPGKPSTHSRRPMRARFSEALIAD
jgi:hypothetical protein